MTTKRIISISLWGDNPRYTEGAIRNAELINIIYPGWKLRIYLDNTVPKVIWDKLVKLDVDVIDFTNKTKLSGHFWRFFAANEDDQITIFRDSDSRFSLREKKCVNSWILQDKKYHIMRDHERHYDFPILAGMWGIKGSLSKEQFAAMELYNNMSYYTVDQAYLSNHIWSECQNDVFISGIKEDPLFKESRKLVVPHFVGQGYDEYNNPIYPIE